MILAIPVDDTKKNVCVSFGRTPYFMFHNTETGESKLLENPAAEAQGGAGLKAAQLIVDENADVLITVRCGENAAEVLKAAEISIYKSEGSSVEENIASYTAGNLAPLTKFHAGYHGLR